MISEYIKRPMMNDREIQIIEGLLSPAFSCFEWGSGGSTLYFPKFVKSWVSFEHDPNYYNEVKKFTKVVEELEVKPWGLKDFRIEDPFGYYLRITEFHNILDNRNAVK